MPNCPIETNLLSISKLTGNLAKSLNYTYKLPLLKLKLNATNYDNLINANMAILGQIESATFISDGIGKSSLTWKTPSILKQLYMDSNCESLSLKKNSHNSAS